MKYLNQDSIKEARDKCTFCAMVASFISVPYLLIWLVAASLAL